MLHYFHSKLFLFDNESDISLTQKPIESYEKHFKSLCMKTLTKIMKGQGMYIDVFKFN